MNKSYNQFTYTCTGCKSSGISSFVPDNYKKDKDAILACLESFIQLLRHLPKKLCTVMTLVANSKTKA